MSEVDAAVNALAGEIVAHPAASRWFLSLSNQDCARVVETLKASGHATGEAIVVLRKTLFMRHCGRRMAVAVESSCPCGNCYAHYSFLVCLCQHCVHVRIAV